MDSILTQLSRFVLDWRQRLLHSSRAHAWGTKLLRLWVRFPPGAGLFLLFLSPSSASLNRSLKEVQHYLISFTTIDDKRCSLGQKKHNMHKNLAKKCSYVYFRAERIGQTTTSEKILETVFFKKRNKFFNLRGFFGKREKSFEWNFLSSGEGHEIGTRTVEGRPDERCFPGRRWLGKKKFELCFIIDPARSVL